MRNRYVAIVLALFLLVGMLAGCASTPTEGSDSTTTTQNGSATTTVGGEDTEPTGGEDITPPTDEQGNPVPTDPTEEDAPSLNTTLPPPIATDAPKTGYAAVGYVNTTSKKATVLLDDGSDGTVDYTDTAPKAGLVYKYQRNANGKYAFTSLKANAHVKQVNPLTEMGLAMYGNASALYMWSKIDSNDPLRHYNLEGVPVFVRYSKTKWALTDTSNLNVNQGDKVSYAYLLDVKKQSDYKDEDCLRWYTVGAMMIGSANGSIAAPQLDNFKEITNKVELAPSTVPTTKPTAGTTKPTAGTTKPTSATTKPTTAVTTVASGYAAVGEISTSAKKATILMDNGTKATVSYTGTAPRSGAVYRYEKKSNNSYVFTEPTSNAHFAPEITQLGTSGIMLWGAPQGWMWSLAHDNDSSKVLHYRMTNVPIFIRYSATEWRLAKVSDIVANNGDRMAQGYVLDAKRASDYADAQNRRWHTVGAMVIGASGGDYIYTPELGLFNHPKANVSLGTVAGPSGGTYLEPTLVATNNNDIGTTGLLASYVHKGNLYRLKKVLQKAASGQKVVIGALGGSITEGMSTSNFSTKKYSSLVYDWFRTTYPNGNFELASAGIGSTGSIIGGGRAEEDLFSKNPDLVIFDFAVNDHYSLLELESYEGLVNRTLNRANEPAVMMLFMTRNDGGNSQQLQMSIGFKYDLPMISYRNCVMQGISEGKYTWSNLSPDVVHPNDRGHALTARLITHRLEMVKNNLNVITDQKKDVPTTTSRFTNTQLKNSQNFTPTNKGAFTGGSTAYYNFASLSKGWTATAGNTQAFTFNTTAKTVTLVFFRSANRGTQAKLDVKVGGQLITTIDPNGLGDYADLLTIINRHTTESVKVELSVSASSAAGSKFSLLGIIQ